MRALQGLCSYVMSVVSYHGQLKSRKKSWIPEHDFHLRDAMWIQAEAVSTWAVYIICKHNCQIVMKDLSDTQYPIQPSLNRQLIWTVQ